MGVFKREGERWEGRRLLAGAAAAGAGVKGEPQPAVGGLRLVTV
jgi:hypothetical protein